MTAERDFGNPNLAALLVWLSNDSRMMMLRQVVAELCSFKDLNGTTRGGPESPKARSQPAKSRKPPQYAYQMKALGLVYRPLPANYLHVS